MRFLVKARANPDIPDKQDGAPIYECYRWSDPELINLLVQLGADVNIKDKAGNTS